MVDSLSRLKKMLTENQIKYITDRENYPVSSELKRQYDYRIREKAKEMIRDLTFIAQNLPEDQKERIFTEESLKDFVKYVLQDTIYTEADYKESNAPKVVINERIFMLGLLFAKYGIDKAYKTIPQKLTTPVAGIIAETDFIKKMELVTNVAMYGLARDIDVE